MRRRRKTAGTAPRKSTTADPAAASPDASGPGAAHRLGRQGEELAAAYLQALGFRIVARNLRTRTGEVDLLVRKRGLLVAVEVKTRRDHGAPERTVTPRQLARLERTLSGLAPLQRRRPRLLRVDVVAVRPTTADTMEVLHFPGRGFPPVGSPPVDRPDARSPDLR